MRRFQPSPPSVRGLPLEFLDIALQNDIFITDLEAMAQLLRHVLGLQLLNFSIILAKQV